MIKKSITYGGKFCSVEHSDRETYSFLQLKKRQKELRISQQGVFADFEALLKKIQGQQHLFLIVNNEQVLTKVIATTNIPEERLVKAAFPNIQLSDFYYQTYSNEQQSFVSISRKEYIDRLIETYAKHKTSVVDFSLGSLSVGILTTFLDQKEIRSSNACISLSEKVITAIEKRTVSETTYEINDLKVSNNQVLPLAGIITYYTGISESKTQKQLHQTYVQKRFFNLGFKGVLGFLFITLLINFLLFSEYQNKETTYKTALQVNGAKKKQLTDLKDIVSRKRTLVESISSSASSRIAWIFNEISASVPVTISLKEMSYQPVEGSIKKDKKIRFTENTIKINGTSLSHKDVTQWIAVLEQKEWIEEVSIARYGSGKKAKTSFDFNIILNE
jgi:Tfp pilus assembly protein PilN